MEKKVPDDKDDPTTKDMTNVTTKRKGLSQRLSLSLQRTPSSQRRSDMGGQNEEMKAPADVTDAGFCFGGSVEKNEKSETPRRRSLPAAVAAMGVQKVGGFVNQFRRPSEKLMMKEESQDPGSTPGSSVEVPNKKPVNGVIRIVDQTEIGMLSKLTENEVVTHLIYGEGYDGSPNSQALPDELILILAATPKLETLELRGFWNFEEIPNLFEFVTSLGRVGPSPEFERRGNMMVPKRGSHELRSLVLPREGKCLGKMGSILIGKYGLFLKTLECPSVFLEETSSRDVLGLLPELTSLRVFDTTVKVIDWLLEAPWSRKLESLQLGQFRAIDSEVVYGLPVKVLEKLATRFGAKLEKFGYLFTVTEEFGEVMDGEAVKTMLDKWMPTTLCEVK